jgi:hypothetical protein
VSALIPEVSPWEEESGIDVLPISVLRRLELEPKGARSELRAAEAGVRSGENAVGMPNCDKPVVYSRRGIQQISSSQRRQKRNPAMTKSH